MVEISRRGLLRGAAAAGLLSMVERELHTNPLGIPIGSQTYPHRQRIKDGDFVGLCRDMATLGVATLELCSPAYREFAALTDAKQTKRIIVRPGEEAKASFTDMETVATVRAEK